jgi:hypothetical protein
VNYSNEESRESRYAGTELQKQLTERCHPYHGDWQAASLRQKTTGSPLAPELEQSAAAVNPRSC